MICGCMILLWDEVVEEIKVKGFLYMCEVMNVFGWNNEEGCLKCCLVLNYYLGMVNLIGYVDECELWFVNECMYVNI